MQRKCFAPANQFDSLYDNFEGHSFRLSSKIWIGYHGEPTKRYRNFSSLRTLVEKARTDFANGHNDKFPLYLTSLDDHFGRVILDNEELKFNAQCSACAGKTNCDCVSLQYFLVLVWDHNSNSCVLWSSGAKTKLSSPYQNTSCRSQPQSQ